MVTSSGSRNVGMQKDHSGTIQRQARKALLREFAGLLMSFGAVTVALQLHGANLGEFEPMVLGLAILAEVLFLWRFVWAALALVAVSSALPKRLHLALGTAIETWGTRSARRSVMGVATTTALAGTLFSGVALADAGTTTDTADYLWASSTTTAEYTHPLDSALSSAAPSGPAALNSTQSANMDNVVLGFEEFEEAHVAVAESQPPAPAPAPKLDQVSGVEQMPPSMPRQTLPSTRRQTLPSTHSLTSPSTPFSDMLSSRPSPRPSTRAMSTPDPLPSSSGDSVHLPTAYTVVEGDYLWDIAQAMLDESASNSEIDALWREIYYANELVIGSDPNQIEPGMILETTPYPTSSSE